MHIAHAPPRGNGNHYHSARNGPLAQTLDALNNVPGLLGMTASMVTDGCEPNGKSAKYGDRDKPKELQIAEYRQDATGQRDREIYRDPKDPLGRYIHCDHTSGIGSATPEPGNPFGGGCGLV